MDIRVLIHLICWENWESRIGIKGIKLLAFSDLSSSKTKVWFSFVNKIPASNFIEMHFFFILRTFLLDFLISLIYFFIFCLCLILQIGVLCCAINEFEGFLNSSVLFLVLWVIGFCMQEFNSPTMWLMEICCNHKKIKWYISHSYLYVSYIIDRLHSSFVLNFWKFYCNMVEIVLFSSIFLF